MPANKIKVTAGDTFCFFFFVIFNSTLFCQPFNNDKIIDTSAAGLIEQLYGSIALDKEGNVGVSWIDDTEGLYIFNYAKSTDHGDSFIKQEVDTVYKILDWVSVDSKLLYDNKGNVWLFRRTLWLIANYIEVFKSDDGGITFEHKTLGSASTSVSYSISSDTIGNIFVFWQQDQGDPVCTKINQGNLNNITHTSLPIPDLTYFNGFNSFSETDGQSLYFIYSGNADPGSNLLLTNKIFFIKSIDWGNSFSAPVQIDPAVNDTVNQNWPDLFLWDNKICAAWSDNRDGQRSLFYTESSDSGAAFLPPLKLSDIYSENVVINYISGNSEMIQITWYSYSGSSYPLNVFFTQKNLLNNTFSTPVKVGDPSYYEYDQLVEGNAVDDSGYSYILFVDNRVNGYFKMYLSREKFTMTDIKDQQYNISGLHLYQNFPNPFNAVTTIKYSVPSGNSELVSLKIYDPLGNIISVLIDEIKPAGDYQIEWNASQFASGVYFFILNCGNYREHKKLIILK